jgi:hypothetical protein
MTANKKLKSKVNSIKSLTNYASYFVLSSRMMQVYPPNKLKFRNELGILGKWFYLLPDLG